MAWVIRDKAGRIWSVNACRQEGYACEELPQDDPEVSAFLNPPAPEPQPTLKDLILAAQEALKTGDTSKLDALAARAAD